MEDVPPASGRDSSDFRVRKAFSARLASWGRSTKRISPRALAAKTMSFFPILQWLPQYKWKVSLFGDLSGGLTMGVFNVPQGIALAAITGVNPVYGLYTAIFPSFFYILFGTSKHNSLGEKIFMKCAIFPSFFYILFGTSKHNSLGGFAVLSLLTAKAIERMDLEWSEANATAPIGMSTGIGSSSMLNLTDSILGNGTAFYDEDSLLVDDVIKAGPNSIAIATALLFTSGVLQLIFGLVHAHYLTCYFSEQVMSGFIVGGVVHVFFAQIGPALGLDLPIRNGPFYLYYRVSDLIDGLPNIHSPTVVISASSIVFLIVNKEFIGPWLDEVFFFPVPFELVLVIVGITATNFAELASRHSIAVVGNMPTNFPVPTAPQLELSFSLFWEALCILIPDFLLAPSFIYLLVRISLSRDKYFHSTFFKFFISAGIGSLATTISFGFFTLITIPLAHLWIFTIIVMGVGVGALGSTVSKFYMCVHRYCVLRDVSMNEHVWSNKIVYTMIALGYAVPLLLNLPLLFMGFNTRMDDGVEVVLMLGNTGTLISKIYSTITYAIYCAGGAVLTILTSKHLSALSELAQESTKQEIQQTQKHLFIVVVCSTISHCLKCAHQIIWSYFAFTNTLTSEIYDNFIFPTYILTNALANYTPPITLIVASNKVRRLLLCQLNNKRNIEGHRTTASSRC